MQPVVGLRATAREYAELGEWCEASAGVVPRALCRIGNSVLLPVQPAAELVWINVGLGVLVEMDLFQAKRFAEEQVSRLEALALRLEQEFAQEFANQRAVELFTLE